MHELTATLARVTDWNEDELFELMRRAQPYRELTREMFEQVLEMLSEGIASQRGRYGAYLHRDRVNHMLRPRRGSRLAAITSGGAIPETALFNVVLEPEGINVGTLDEDFAVESSAGDIMLLGNTSWRIRRVEGKSGRVLVEDAHGAPPTVPFWRGEAPRAPTNFPIMSGSCGRRSAIFCPALRRSVFRRTIRTWPGRLSGSRTTAGSMTQVRSSCRVHSRGQPSLAQYRRRQRSSRNGSSMKRAACS